MSKRVVTDLLRRIVVQDETDRLRKGLERVLTQAATGERWAVEFIRYTLDGKPRQSMAIGADDGLPEAIDLVDRLAKALAAQGTLSSETLDEISEPETANYADG